MIRHDLCKQDKNGHISQDEMDSTLLTLLKTESYKPAAAREIVKDIFNDLDLNQDGQVNKREFLIATSQSDILTTILCTAAEKEKQMLKRVMKPGETGETPPGELLEAEAAVSKRSKKKSKKKKKKKDVLDKYISPRSSRGGSPTPEFTRMSRRRSIF